MTESVSFDRAAAFYDATRSLTPAGEAAVTEVLAGEMRGRGRCLEIGVGTGRVALPLAGAGIDVAGVDISRAMLAELAAKPGAEACPVVVADATSLPFPDGAFGAVFACHVFHLVPAWEDAVAEAARVLCPGGVLAVNLGDVPEPLRELREHFAAEAGTELSRPGCAGFAAMDEASSALGSVGRWLPDVTDVRTRRFREFLLGLELNLFSWTWALGEDVRTRAAEATAAWAEERYGDSLDAEREIVQLVRWRVYDFA